MKITLEEKSNKEDPKTDSIHLIHHKHSW